MKKNITSQTMESNDQVQGQTSPGEPDNEIEYFNDPDPQYNHTVDLLGTGPDTEGIGYRFIDDNGTTIGYVESVNGTGSAGCSEFEATRSEMLLIARHWYQKLCEIEWQWYQQSSAGHTHWRTAEYAKRRLSRIRHYLGARPVNKVIAEVDTEFRAQVGSSEWERFNSLR